MNWIRNIILAAVVVTAPAQPTTPPAKTDYSYFRLIPDRNIFNPNRYPHHTSTRHVESVRPASADTLALVGTMSYAKGTFAFFDGTSDDYRKVLERDGTIAGYKLTAITPDSVALTMGTTQIELKVGAQLRRTEDGGWAAGGASELPALTNAGPVSLPAAAAASGTTADPGDVLKRLMQQREQELK